MNVQHMTGRTGRAVVNQFIITMTNHYATTEYFQSYNSIIAKRVTSQFSGKVFIRLDINKWDYSTTTGKYRNKFLGEIKRETEKKIKSGEYVLTNLN